MTTYKAIHGKTIQHLASDPDSAAYEGQIWFNTASSDYKTIQKVAGAWSTGGTGNTVKNYPGGGGSQTAAWVAGGETPASPAYDVIHEQYDGTSWTEVADINTGRYECFGTGTTTAAIVAQGGAAPGSTVNSEEWNGSSWTEGSNANVGRKAMASAGTQTAALSISGANYPELPADVESYDGSSWTQTTDVNTGGYYVKGNGTQTAALISGRTSFASPAFNNGDKTETWDGSSWTEGASLNTVRGHDMAAFGTSTAAIHAGGSGGSNVANSEQWDGSSWTEVGDLATAIRYTASSSNTSISSGLQMFGYTSAKTAIVQEWNFDSTLAAGAWASGGTHPTSNLANVGSAGTQTAAISVGGGSSTTTCIEYNGTAWSSNPNAYPLGAYGLHGAGTATTGLFFGGRGGTSYLAEAFTFDGTSFSAVNDINSARYYHGGAGTATAAVGFGGHDGSDRGYTEEFDGTNWAESGDLNTARDQGASTGTQTAALFVGGSPGGAGATVVEEYNGTSWSEVTDIATATQTSSGNGTQTAALIAGGETHPGSATIAECYTYDGSTFTTVADLSTSRYAHGELSGSAPSNLSVVFAGAGGGTTTEEWTVAQNIKTITD